RGAPSIPAHGGLVNAGAPPGEPQIGNIVEPRRGLIVLKSPVALHVSFPDRPRAAANGYPESLMGVIAFVRQSFLDARHYAEGARTDDDAALEAMQPAIERRLPVAFEANESRQILRALKLAQELKLEPILTGARHAD